MLVLELRRQNPVLSAVGGCDQGPAAHRGARVPVLQPGILRPAARRPSDPDEPRHPDRPAQEPGLQEGARRHPRAGQGRRGALGRVRRARRAVPEALPGELGLGRALGRAALRPQALHRLHPQHPLDPQEGRGRPDLPRDPGLRVDRPHLAHGVLRHPELLRALQGPGDRPAVHHAVHDGHARCSSSRSGSRSPPWPSRASCRSSSGIAARTVASASTGSRCGFP